MVFQDRIQRINKANNRKTERVELRQNRVQGSIDFALLDGLGATNKVFSPVNKKLQPDSNGIPMPSPFVMPE